MVKPPQTQTMVTVFAYNREKPAQALCVVRQAPVPELLPGHVLVETLWRPVNPSDIMWCVLLFFPSLSCVCFVCDSTQIMSCRPLSPGAYEPRCLQPAGHVRRLQASQAPGSARPGG